MNAIKQGVVYTALAIAVAAGTGTAGADPTPTPGPYQIITPHGPVIGGLPNLPAICAVQPRACALNYDPNTGAWERPPGTDPN